MVKKLLDFIVLMLIWVALTWSLTLPDIIAGIVVSSIIILIFSDLIPMEINYLLNPKRMFWALVYIPAFIWQVIKSKCQSGREL